jgi:hypothetical protein
MSACLEVKVLFYQRVLGFRNKVHSCIIIWAIREADKIVGSWAQGRWGSWGSNRLMVEDFVRSKLLAQ